MIRYTRHILLLALSAVVAYSYHPKFFNELGEMTGGMNRIVLLLTIVLFLLILPTIRSTLKNPFIKTYLILLGIIALEVILFYGLGWNISFNEIRTLLIPLVLLIIGYIACDDVRIMRGICLIYTFIILYVCFEQILQNIGGFIVEDQYNTSAKNSLGPMLAVAGVISVSFIMRTTHWVERLLMCIIAFIILFELLTIRARLAMLAYGIVVILMLYKYIENIRKKLRFISRSLVIVLIIGITCSFYIDWFLDFVYDSFTQNKEDDILSGRGAGYASAWRLLSEYPFFGNLVANQHIPWVHNYVLLKLSDMGIIGSLSWLILYGYIGYRVGKAYISFPNILKIENIGYILIFIPFIVSLGEPTFPYGPGTANFVSFLLLGSALNVRNL